MLVIYLDLALAAWLLISAFALGNTPTSATVIVLAALIFGALVWASLKRPSLRIVNGAVMLLLAILSVVLPSISAAARINTAVVALVLLALTAVSPGHARSAPPRAAGPGGTSPPAPH